MAAADLLGGVGKGLMMGADFVARRHDMADRKDFQGQILDMQKQTHDAQMQATNYQLDKIDLNKKMQDAATNLTSDPEYQAADPNKKGKMLAQKVAPFATPEMQFALTDQIGRLDKLIGRDALSRAVAFKDFSGVVELLKERDPTFKHEIRGDNGEEFWASINGRPLAKIDTDGIGTALGFAEEIEQNRAKMAGAALGVQYKRAQIGKLLSETAETQAKTEKLLTPEPKPAFGFKTPADIFEFIKNSIPETGIEINTSTGKMSNISREEAASGIQPYFSRLAEGNPGMDPAMLRNEAMNMYRQANGGMLDGGNYEPTYELTPQGHEVPYIRTKDGLSLIYYSPSAKRDDNSIMDAQDRWVELAKRQDIPQKFIQMFNDEHKTDLFVRGLNDPGARSVMERESPGIYNQARMLYARGLLPGVTIADPSFEAARKQLEERDARRSVIKTGFGLYPPQKKEEEDGVFSYAMRGIPGAGLSLGRRLISKFSDDSDRGFSRESRGAIRYVDNAGNGAPQS